MLTNQRVGRSTWSVFGSLSRRLMSPASWTLLPHGLSSPSSSRSSLLYSARTQQPSSPQVRSSHKYASRGKGGPPKHRFLSCLQLLHLVACASCHDFASQPSPSRSLPSPSDPTCFSVRFLGDQLHLVSSPWMMPMRAIWLEESCPIVRTAPKASPLSILRIQLVSAYGSTVIGCAWCLHQEGCRCGLFGSRKAVRSCERPQRLHHEASCVCASFGSMKPNTYGAYTAKGKMAVVVGA